MREETPAVPVRWYRVVEVWLILGLLTATVIGSLALVVVAVRGSDPHLAVPDDVPRSSRLPPLQQDPNAPRVPPPEHDASGSARPRGS